jgi:hypothetical protein
MEVRQARAADWETLRELRLRALADAPDAFASTLRKEAEFPEQVWRQRAEGAAGSVNFIACEDGAGIGMAAIFTVANAPRMYAPGGDVGRPAPPSPGGGSGPGRAGRALGEGAAGP